MYNSIKVNDNPKDNEDSPGFYPEEREWMDEFIDRSGYIDTFRMFNKQGNNYTWWSYRQNSRVRNKGWRLDYNFVSHSLKNQLERAVILKEVFHSDHCPVLVKFNTFL